MTFRPNHRILLAAILGLALGIRLWHAVVIREAGIAEIPRYYADSDMNANLEWASTIVDGDVLGRETYHPYADWAKEIAPQETWYKWWGGRAIFQQAPLYPYLLAGLWSITGVSLWAAVLLQLIFGALQPLIFYALAARLLGRPAGLIAAALVAIYAPGIALQGTLLRDWLPAMLDPLALWLILRGEDSGRPIDFGLAGLTLGLSILAKETGVLVLLMVLIWLVAAMRRPGRPVAGAILAVSLGATIAVSPLMIRNIVVGAPLLALSNRTAEALVAGNAADGFPVGVYFPPSTKSLLEHSSGRTVPLIREILAGYRGHYGRLMGNIFLKTRGLLGSFEVPDNVSFEYLRSRSPALRVLDWGMLVPLALAGLVLVWPVWRRRGLLLGYAAVITSGMLATLVLGRYRLPLAMPLIVFAAGGLSQVLGVWRHHRGRLMVAGGVLVAGTAFLHLVCPISQLGTNARYAINSSEYSMLATHWAEQEDYSRAVGELDVLLQKAAGPPAFPDVLRIAGNARAAFQLEWAKQRLAVMDTTAARNLTDLAARYTETELETSYLNFELGRLYARLGDELMAHLWLDRYLTREPEGENAVEARSLLSQPVPAPR